LYKSKQINEIVAGFF